MEGGVNNPAVSQRVATAGWIVEETRRRYAFTEARHLKALLLPDHAPDAFAYLVSMGDLLGSTVIQRRGSLLMRTSTIGSSFKTDAKLKSGAKDDNAFIKNMC